MSEGWDLLNLDAGAITRSPAMENNPRISKRKIANRQPARRPRSLKKIICIGCGGTATGFSEVLTLILQIKTLAKASCHG